MPSQWYLVITNWEWKVVGDEEMPKTIVMTGPGRRDYPEHWLQLHNQTIQKKNIFFILIPSRLYSHKIFLIFKTVWTRSFIHWPVSYTHNLVTDPSVDNQYNRLFHNLEIQPSLIATEITSGRSKIFSFILCYLIYTNNVTSSFFFGYSPEVTSSYILYS